MLNLARRSPAEISWENYVASLLRFSQLDEIIRVHQAKLLKIRDVSAGMADAYCFRTRREPFGVSRTRAPEKRNPETIMDYSYETNWYTLQSKPRRESLAAASVSEFEIEVFLPRIRQAQVVCGVERLVTKPLFGGYFFARFCPSLLLESVRYARGVLRVVGSAHFPIPLDEEIIAAIRDRIEPDGFIRLEASRFEPGDQVIIEQGPLAGWMGKVQHELDDGRRVMILLEAIKQARVLVERRCLALVPDTI